MTHIIITLTEIGLQKKGLDHMDEIISKIYETFKEKIIPKDKDYRSLTKKIEDGKEYFMKNMATEDKERFEILSDCIHDCNRMMTYAHFVFAWKLSAKFIAETFIDDIRALRTEFFGE